MENKIYVNMRRSVVEAGILGPFRRYCLWVSGCCRNCEGCISPESHNMYDGTPKSPAELAWEVIPSDVEGITISGGEPFLQAPALCEFIKTVKNQRDIGVIVYTGFLFEELRMIKGGEELIKLCDLIIDGPYIKELDDGCALRGSSNQRVIPITDRYKDFLHLYGKEGRKVSIETSPLGDEIQFIGIPENSNYYTTKEKHK